MTEDTFRSGGVLGYEGKEALLGISSAVYDSSHCMRHDQSLCVDEIMQSHDQLHNQLCDYEIFAITNHTRRTMAGTYIISY